MDAAAYEGITGSRTGISMVLLPTGVDVAPILGPCQ